MQRKGKLAGIEWVPDTGDFIKINPDLCTGCARCVVVCFGNCLKIRRGKAIVASYETCCECGVCWFICPENAIEFSWPRGGTGIRIEYG